MTTSVLPAPMLEGIATMHAAMRRDAERLLRGIEWGGAPRRRHALLRWYGRYTATIEAHHRREDTVLWPVLLERCADFAEARQSLEADHVLLDASIADTRRALERFARASTADRERQAEALRTATSLAQLLDAHLTAEEDAAFERIAAGFTPDEYHQLERQMLDDMGFADLAFELPWAFDGLDPAAQERMLAPLPPAMRVAHRLVLRPRYHRLAAVVRDERRRSSRTTVGGRTFVAVNRASNAIVRRLPLRRFRGAPVLSLTTIGRRTGKARTTPLIYLQDGERWIVVASNGGADWEPGWARNLAAGMPAHIQVGGERIEVAGSEIHGPERELLWPRLNEMWDYDAYQAKVSRRIAVIALQRARAGAAPHLRAAEPRSPAAV